MILFWDIKSFKCLFRCSLTCSDFDYPVQLIKLSSNRFACDININEYVIIDINGNIINKINVTGNYKIMKKLNKSQFITMVRSFDCNDCYFSEDHFIKVWDLNTLDITNKLLYIREFDSILVSDRLIVFNDYEFASWSYEEPIDDPFFSKINNSNMHFWNIKTNTRKIIHFNSEKRFKSVIKINNEILAIGLYDVINFININKSETLINI